MIKVICGNKGMGKTKKLIDSANELAAAKNGDVVFIDTSNQLMYDLKHEVRFINFSEFPIHGGASFLGFICGIISEDYDIDTIFIDDLEKMTGEDAVRPESVFKGLNKISEKYNINFQVGLTGEPDMMPDFVKSYII